MPTPTPNSLPPIYADPPYDLVNGLGWLALFGLLVALNWVWWRNNRGALRQNWLVLVGLAIATPILVIILPVKIPVENALPMPGLPVEPWTPVMFVLAGLPWVLAAGLLEPLWVCALGALTGLVVGLYDTHHYFTFLEYAGLAALYGMAVRQRYRGWLFGLIRHPLGAALILAVVYAPVYMITTFLAAYGPWVARLDYAITQTWPIILIRGSEMILASLLAEGIYLARASFWGKRGPLVPSPFESSLQLRFFFTTAPMVLIFFLTLTIGDWLVAGAAARNMLRERVESTARLASSGLPYFLEAGQNLLLLMADPEIMSLKGQEQTEALSQRLRSAPYFTQFFLFDEKLNLLSGYPKDTSAASEISSEELKGVDLALKGVMVQTYIVPRQSSMDTSVEVSFLAPIQGEQSQVVGVLLGRTRLNENVFTQPSIQALVSVGELDGAGYILDEEGRILYSPNKDLLLQDYREIGRIPSRADFFEEISSSGTRQLVYFQPMVGKNWGVVVSVPAERAQQLALDIAIPLLAILLVLSAVVFIVLRLSLRSVATSMKVLADGATTISQGRLDQPLVVKGVDEVGQVSRAFEQMRLSLKARLDELNRLLKVSQGVAANLEAGDALRPVLDAAMGDHAAMARVVLQAGILQELWANREVVFGVGPFSDLYSYLDDQIFNLMKTQEVITIPNTNRVRRLAFKTGQPQPGAVVAVALHHENRYLGALWVAYEQPRNFSEEEVRFLGTLGGQASIAASNAALYAMAEIGRQRLEAVLVSTPEPVLVFDENLRLLLLNASALQVPGLVASHQPGQPVQSVLAHKDLIDLLNQTIEDKIASREIALANGMIYFASVSPVNSGGRMVGKVCVLQNITHYTELNKLKSDFVTTVSHDLRSPLTLVRGYATMLQMVGELNEQQKNYARNIISGVESMKHLVNNLLDLGRIDAGFGLKIERVMVQDVIEQVLASFQPQATQKSIQLSQEGLDLPPVFIEADRALFQQALLNLTDNAVKYTPTGGQVRIRLRPGATSVVVEVLDNGIGIAPLDLPHMFERFYRSSRREAHTQQGTGLGLAIVKSIVDRHGGRVRVESQLGKGSIFYLEFPYSAKKVENPKN